MVLMLCLQPRRNSEPLLQSTVKRKPDQKDTVSNLNFLCIVADGWGSFSSDSVTVLFSFYKTKRIKLRWEQPWDFHKPRRGHCGILFADPYPEPSSPPGFPGFRAPLSSPGGSGDYLPLVLANLSVPGRFQVAVLRIAPIGPQNSKCGKLLLVLVVWGTGGES